MALQIAMLVPFGIGAFLISKPALTQLTTGEAIASDLLVPAWISIAATLLTFLAFLQKNTNDGMQKPLAVGICFLIGNLVSVAAAVALITNLGLVALALGQLLGAVFTLTASIVIVNRELSAVGAKPRFCRIKAWDLLAISPTIVVARIVSAVMVRFDQVAVTALLGPILAVHYSIARRAADVVQMIGDKLVGSAAPAIAHFHGQHSRDPSLLEGRLCKLFGTVFGIVTLCLCSFCLLNSSFVQLWLGPEYRPGAAMNLGIASYVAASLLASALAATLSALGDMARPAWMGVGEASLRAALLVHALGWCGIVAIPLVGAATLLALGIWSLRRLSSHKVHLASRSSIVALAGTILLAVTATAIGDSIHSATWIAWTAYGVLGTLAISAVSLVLNRTLRIVVYEEVRLRLQCR